MKTNKIECEDDYDMCLAMYQLVKYTYQGEYFHALKMELAHMIAAYEEEISTLK